MIRRGLRIDDDDQYKSKQERVTLDANRKRDNFQKDMDNFLFGGPPVKRRQVKKQEPQKSIPPPVVVIKQQISSIKKPQTQTLVQVQQAIFKKAEQIKRPVISSPTEKVFQKIVSQVTTTKTQMIQSRHQQNSSLKGSKVSKGQQSSISMQKSQVQSKILGQRQKSQYFADIESSRPNYIRKLKYASENYNFSDQNSKNHKFIDIVRPIQCLRSHVQRKDIVGFKDKQFPASKISLGMELQNYQVEWKKCEQFFNHSTLGKYIDPNDIKKGTFSSSKFLSSLSILAERQENIKRVIQEQCLNPNCLYYVRLYINSVWRYYAVDSYFPFFQNKAGGATSYNDSQSDLWITLIQKAYAKAFNGYNVFTRPQPREYYFRDLTGAPTSNYKIDNPELLNLIKKAIESRKVVAAIPKSNVQNLGLNPNYTLAVLGSNKKGGLTLRYGWPLIQDKSGIPISKQGVFQLSDTQISEYISYVAIAHVNRQYYTTTIQTRHQKEFYVAYKIVVKQNIHGYFTVTQLDERMLPKEGYVYQPARIFLHKKIDNNKYQYVNGGFSHMSRNLDLQVNLTPGQYDVFAYINWNYPVYDFNLTFYGSKPIDFVKIPTLKNPNLISLGLQAYNVQNGRRSALGHVNQFIIHHQQTNQILISILNTSNKNYKYTNDLKKINFQSLHLMNLKSNQHEMISLMTKEELQYYKSQALQNRKWQIDLQPQETFTWVISTSELFDSNNFRNWGFR